MTTLLVLSIAERGRLILVGRDRGSGNVADEVNNIGETVEVVDIDVLISIWKDGVTIWF